MSKKPPEPPRDDADTDPPDALSGEDNDPTAPTGIPAVSRNIELAAEAALASMLVSYSKSERLSGPENERATMPPPVPMEQLVENMMVADSDRAPPPDIKPLRAPTISDSIPPPGSDVDTVRTKMADMQRVPMSPVPASPTPPSTPPDDAPTLPPYPDTADTLPPANIDDDTEPGFRDFIRHEPPPAASVTARAIDAAEAVFEELGVEFFKTRSTSKDVVLDEPIRPRVVEERPKPSEERWRPPPGARLTPPRTMRPVPDATPPSSSSGRNPAQRRRISEPGMRAVEPPQQFDRPPPSSSSSVSDRLIEVRERYETGDHRSALRIAETILSEQPGHLAALGYAESSRQMLRQKYLARIGDLTMVPRLKPVAIELARLGFDGRDTRVVDAIDGVSSVEDIVTAAGLPTLDVLRVLYDLAVDGLVEFVGPATGRR